MKKFKLAFATIALVALLCAFATSKVTISEFEKQATNDYEPLDPQQEGVPGGWFCDNPPDPVCTYKIKTGIIPHSPLIDADMEPNRYGTFKRIPLLD